MEVYISINGVLRNFIQKFDYHYRDCFLENDIKDLDEDIESFDYNVKHPVYNDNVLKYYTFQSKEEYNNFCYIEYALELFGHSGVSYQGVMLDLNKIIYENKNINFTVIGIDELGKAKPSTLFFLSKNGFLGNNIKFIKSEDIEKEWNRCNIWITDSEEILDKCPKNKIGVKFNTIYNDYFYKETQINKLTEITELCLKYLENTTSSTLMKLLESAVQIMGLKGLMRKNN